MAKDKVKAALYVKERRNRIKSALVALVGGSCTQCGYSKCLASLEFHHPDDTSKDFGLSYRGMWRTFDVLALEASKTVLLCSNCHREAHHLTGFVLMTT